MLSDCFQHHGTLVSIEEHNEQIAKCVLVMPDKLYSTFRAGAAEACRITFQRLHHHDVVKS